MPSLRLLAPLALVPALLGPWLEGRAATLEEPPGEPELAELVARDDRAGFTARTGEAAAADLARPSLSGRTRRAGLVALGIGGRLRARPTLESVALEDPDPDARRAAVLGLGELGTHGPQDLGDAEITLVELVDDADPRLAECALLALGRAGRLEWVAAVAADLSNPRAESAADVLAFLEQPGSATCGAARELFDLRWAAAKRYGTVDGQAWDIAVVDALTRDDTFMEEVVLRAAAPLAGKYRGVRDHFLEILFQHRTPVVLRAAVVAMPVELDRLIDAGLWKPTEDEWRTIVDEAVRTRNDVVMRASLRRAADVPDLVPRVAALLHHRRRPQTPAIVASLDSPDPAVRAAAATALADIGEKTELRALQRLDAATEDPDVRAAALAARMRLRDEQALARGRALLAGTAPKGEGVDRKRLLHVLARTCIAADDLDLLGFLTELVQDDERALLLAAMAVERRTVDTSFLRARYPEMDVDSEEATSVLRALGRSPAHEDLEFIAELFPLEDDPRANVELALALIRANHAEAQPILRAAVWSGPWNRSVLAAAVVQDTSGARVLQQWVSKPPADATSTDIRRLGFAIGEWGGMDALWELAQLVGGGAQRPALQGALLGALTHRTH